MKRNIYIVLSLLIIALLFNACKNNPTASTPNNGTGSSYFPNGDGTNYKYSIVQTDSAKNQTSGTRSATYSGTTIRGSITYQNEIDTIQFSLFSAVTRSLFVKNYNNNNAVMISIDTTGFSDLVPDTLRQYISMDQNITIFQFPFQSGSTWPVFNMSLKLGVLSINLVSVTANYIGTEQVALNLTSGNVTQTAARIQYTLKLTIPNPNNIFAAPLTSTYLATAWVADNIGIIKVQGNSTLLDAFTGLGINFADTTSTITQSLISYNIK